MKKVIPIIFFLAGIFYSCEQEDLAPKVAGTYYGAYTTPTDSFAGNVYINYAAKNKIDIDLLIDSGSNSITLYDVGVYLDDDENYRYTLANADDQVYSVWATYFHKSKILDLTCFTSSTSAFQFIGNK